MVNREFMYFRTKQNMHDIHYISQKLVVIYPARPRGTVMALSSTAGRHVSCEPPLFGSCSQNTYRC